MKVRHCTDMMCYQCLTAECDIDTQVLFHCLNTPGGGVDVVLSRIYRVGAYFHDTYETFLRNQLLNSNGTCNFAQVLSLNVQNKPMPGK